MLSQYNDTTNNNKTDIYIYVSYMIKLLFVTETTTTHRSMKKI